MHVMGRVRRAIFRASLGPARLFLQERIQTVIVLPKMLAPVDRRALVTEMGHVPCGRRDKSAGMPIVREASSSANRRVMEQVTVSLLTSKTAHQVFVWLRAA